MNIKSVRIKLIQFLIHLNEMFIFYPRLKRYYKSVLSNKNILLIDVGVNKGQSINFFNKINSSINVIGFEPNHKLFDFLNKKYRLNKNIQIFQNGISSKKGNLYFNENIMDETSTFENVNSDSTYLKKKAAILGLKHIDELILNRYEVEVISLSDFIIENNIKHLDVLKIDTEGHEYDCLVGLFQKNTNCKIDYIQLESHNDDMYFRKDEHSIDQLLSQHNYFINARIRHGFGGLEELIYKKIEIE